MKRRPERSYLYGLAEPATGVIRYIGQSLQPRVRFSQHLTESRQTWATGPMYHWIQALAKQDTRPQLIILGVFSPADITKYEDQMIRLLNADGNGLFNYYRASSIGYHGEAQDYTIQCVETGEEFPSYAAAGRAYGCTPEKIRQHHENNGRDGLHFRKVDHETKSERRGEILGRMREERRKCKERSKSKSRNCQRGTRRTAKGF